MINYKLSIGDLLVSKEKDVTFTCYGLGSCIGLFVQDRTTGICGGAHIQLPSDSFSYNTSIGKYYSAQSAIEQIVNQFKSKGSNCLSLRAKIVGGSSMYGSSYDIGVRNIHDTITLLSKNLIYVAASDTGGKLSRTAFFNCTTGELIVRIAETNEIKVF